MLNIVPVLRFLADEGDAGRGTVLVVITQVTGASTRTPGAIMGVSETGAFAGSLSGGCIEAAVVAEAHLALAQQQPREIRYGAGSPIIDIRLPCGGAIDLLLVPLVQSGLARAALDALAQRYAVTMILPRKLGIAAHLAEPRCCRKVERADEFITLSHLPPPRLLVLGQGAAVDAIHAQADAFGAAVDILSPDQDQVSRILSAGGRAEMLKAHGRIAKVDTDPWTACVFFFHDHDWEAPLLVQALESDAFYIGAMGSLRTHQKRLELLRQHGATDSHMQRLVAPIGLIPSSRDPEVLALSTLAQIIEQFEIRFQA